MEAKTISIVLSAIRFRPFSTLTDCSCKFAQKNKKMKEQTFLCTVNSKKTAPSSPLNLIITPLKSPESTAGKWPRIQEPPGIFPAFTISLIARSFHFAFRTLFLPADNSMFFYQYAWCTQNAIRQDICNALQP